MTKNIIILKRPQQSEYYIKPPILLPSLPYHKRLENYINWRDDIFSTEEVSLTQPKRSTLRLRKYFKLRKLSKRFLVSAIISNPKDKRYYAKISFLDQTEYGLIDIGANINCFGSDLAAQKFPNFTKCKSYVRTADGKPQNILGWIDVEVKFKNVSHEIKFFLVPSISQWVILGVDFSKTFHIFDNIIGSMDVLSIDNASSLAPTIEKLPVPGDFPVDNNKSEEIFFPLSEVQKSQLETIMSLFPSFEKLGLGRTSLIQQKIEVNESSPIKQRHYPVSPAIEKLMFKVVDRMLDLGVIEPSSSAWSSPIRLVVKPNKIRLCLDARRLNSVTKNDAYPLPSIEGIFARLPKANVITKLDVKDAYWQIALDDSSKSLTAFTVPGRPLYQFVVMPFGL